MTLIFCLDDHNGIMFNGRRQSSDKAVTERIMNYADGHKLLISAYSAKLLPAGEVFDGQFQQEDVVFAESSELIDLCIDKADKLILYRWNRAYPADVHIPAQLLAEGWHLEERTDFIGNSHDLITQEVYIRE